MNLLETFSGLAVRHLKQEQLFALRTAYHSVRNRLYPVMRAVYGTFDTKTLRGHLEQRLGTDFEILMVHSSVNNMKPMYTDSALDLVRMLISFCGPSRTLVMPAFYFGDPAIGGAYATFKQRPAIRSAAHTVDDGIGHRAVSQNGRCRAESPPRVSDVRPRTACTSANGWP